MTNDKTPTTAAPVDQPSSDDAAWFAAHPDRQFRLRHRIGGEFVASQIQLPTAGLSPRTLVIQAQPGAWLRQPVDVQADVRNDDVTDRQLFAFFEQAASADVKDAVRTLRKARLPDKPNPEGPTD